jgi:peptide/nickel transport system permease protein
MRIREMDRSPASFVAFAVRRLMGYVAIYVLLAFVLFGLFHAFAGDQFAPPGHKRTDPVSDYATTQRIEWELDRSVIGRFLSWARTSLRLGFGVSIWSLEPPDAYWWDAASFAVGHQMIGSLLLLGTSIAFVAILALPLGIAAALRPDSVADRIARWIGRLFGSSPGFLLAVGLLVATSLALYEGRLGLRFDGPHAPYRLWPAPLFGAAARAGWHVLVSIVVLALPLAARTVTRIRRSVDHPALRARSKAFEAQGHAAPRAALRAARRPAVRAWLHGLPGDVEMLFFGTVVGAELFGWPTMGRFLTSVLPRDAHAGLVLSSLLWFVGLLLAVRFVCDVALHLLARGDAPVGPCVVKRGLTPAMRA